jgi:hypothetical protein
MKLSRFSSHRLFQLVWLLAGTALPSGIANAVPAPEYRTALFAAG